MPPPSPIDEAYQTLELTASEFSEIRRLANDLFALDLKPGKESLVSARMRKRVRESGVRTVSEYIRLLRSDASGERLAALIDDLTTNFTSFLREPSHFQFLRNIILAEFPAPQPLRIWSAGCSTGEEPYSILFTLFDAEPGAGEGRFEIRATDISRPALDKACAGIYPKDRFEQFPLNWMPRYLQAGQAQWSAHYRVKRSLASSIRFERRNLRDSFDDLPTFHVIFCRNVMIYFDRRFRQDLVARFASRLVAGGYLFVGHSEGLMGLAQDLEFIEPAIYRKPGLKPGLERRGP